MGKGRLVDLSEISSEYQGKDKIGRYGWGDITDEPGAFTWIDKRALKVDTSYQRSSYISPSKVSRMVSRWSWGACGVLVVAQRGEDYYAVDGQNRILAALRRSDITHLPCIVFPSKGVKWEAELFYHLNCMRRMPPAIAQFTALLCSGDETCTFIKETCDAYGIVLGAHRGVCSTMGCTGVLLSIAKKSREDLQIVVSMMASLCGSTYPMIDKLVKGLYYLHRYCEVSLLDAVLRDRILRAGYENIMRGAEVMEASMGKIGDKVFALGMLSIINKGYTKKYSLATAGNGV